MKEAEIKKYYKKKINELKNHNKLYFEKTSPKKSDKEYLKRNSSNISYWFLTQNKTT